VAVRQPVESASPAFVLLAACDNSKELWQKSKFFGSGRAWESGSTPEGDWQRFGRLSRFLNLFIAPRGLV
jgi:hypothetical protein